MTKTNAYSILCVFIRVFALWLFATTVIGLPQTYLVAMRYASPEHSFAAMLGGSGFALAMAALLWIFADKFAKAALARPQQVVFESDMPMLEWQTIAFSVLGLWLVVDGLVYLTGRIVRIFVLYFGNVPGETHPQLPDDFYTWLVSDIVRVSIGIALLFGSRGLVRLVQRYRQVGFVPEDSSGTRHPAEADDADSSPPPSI